MSQYAQTGKQQAIACFIVLCVMHAAAFSLTGIFADAKMIPAKREMSPLIFEFVPPAQNEAPPVTRITPPLEIPPAPVENAVPDENAELAFEAEEAHPVAAAVSAESAAEPAYATAAPSRAMSESDYIALIMRRLEEKKVYPLAMRKRGIEGAMPVQFTIHADGTLARVTADDRAAHPFLAQAALETVKSASPFPVREGIESDFSLQVTIRYELK
jgi:protein TonB